MAMTPTSVPSFQKVTQMQIKRLTQSKERGDKGSGLAKINFFCSNLRKIFGANDYAPELRIGTFYLPLA